MTTLTGCWKPYHAEVLEKVDTSEVAFLIPLTGDTTKQVSFDSEAFLKEKMVATKEVVIPHRWHQTGYYSWTGEWIPAARLIKVDRAPVTREWTAEKDSGTSDKDEAIWVMTSDSVMFSTGWTCTARIESEDDAIKFLFNYPGGSLSKVMDGELRAKLQSQFGLAVTDREMDELRMKSTPVFEAVTKSVTAFFKERGITVTNLGITGGYVYRDAKIQETLNKVFQAQQDVNTAIAKTKAQMEANKAVKLEAEGLADAARMKAKGAADAAKTQAEGEAAAIKAVAEAKAFELTKAKEDPKAYFQLKQIEVDTLRLKTWDGKYPTTLFQGAAPDLLLNVPAFATPAK